jgi:hypothetical protein
MSSPTGDGGNSHPEGLHRSDLTAGNSTSCLPPSHRSAVRGRRTLTNPVRASGGLTGTLPCGHHRQTATAARLRVASQVNRVAGKLDLETARRSHCATGSPSWRSLSC